MTEQEFDTLWQRTEAEPYAARLLEEYPVWRHNRRRNNGIAASIVVAAAVALPLLTIPKSAPSHDNHTATYCNRPDMTEQYWVEMADALLKEA